ncbi:MAG: transcription antitermination factor NusB [Oscillospiraceae bacterium]|nr:transcription antitermination factor NusB [Oscillospiraceae bacterium]
MKRTTAREIAMHFSFENAHSDSTADELLERRFDPEYYPSLAQEAEIYAEFPDTNQREYIDHVVKGIAEHGYELDTYIEKYSKGWRFERISRTALAIMRLAMYEILYTDVPDAVAVNEAVEIAKKYEEAEAVSFINGILGSFVRGEKE